MSARPCQSCQQTPTAPLVEERKRRFLRVKDVCAELGVSRGHVETLIKRGSLECYTLDGVKLISAESLDAYLATAERWKPPAKGGNDD